MNNIEELHQIYDSLIELGVIFYYESSHIPHGEITDIKFNSEEIQIQIDEEKWHDICYEDFQENHSKEGNNYHTWSLTRQFDNLME